MTSLSNACQQQQPQKSTESRPDRKQSKVRKSANTAKKPVSLAATDTAKVPPMTSSSKPAQLSTLFVKGLPSSTTIESIRELFREYAIDANSIRTITDRKTQKLKNFAYVDFADKTVAQQAIDDLNGKPIGTTDVPLFVAFSDPPKKQTESRSSTQNAGHEPHPQRPVKKKLDCALIPTVLKRRKLDDVATVTDSTEPVKTSVSLSNADFRDKFL